MRATTKICGLSTVETISTALSLGASHIGYVFHEKSPRNVTVKQVLSINHALGLDRSTRSRGVLVGVMVDPDPEFAEQTAWACELAVIQLHGRETPQQVAYLKRRIGVEIWKAVPIKTRADLSVARAYVGTADRLLYDAKTPDGAPLPGGMGLRFDWGLLDGFDHPLPWALSGGLNATNVGEAIRRTGAPLVDVSSGVESAPGVKDVARIEAFLKAVANE